MSRKRALAACGYCYIAACILTSLFGIPMAIAHRYLPGDCLPTCVCLPLSLPAASFLGMACRLVSERLEFFAATPLLGYVVHIGLVVATVRANERFRYAVFCVFVMLLVLDVYFVAIDFPRLLPARE